MYKASIIITTFNRPETLMQSLQALSQQTISSSKFEVLIIEGDSTMPSVECIKTFNSLNIKYLYEALPGVTPARHRGLEESKSDILVYLEDDGVPEVNWLESILVTFHSKPDVAMIGGKNLPLFEKKPPHWIHDMWVDIPEGKVLGELTLIDLGKTNKYINPSWIWALNLAIRKEVILEVGGFNPDLSPAKLKFFQGDGECGLAYKVEDKGYKGYYVANAVVKHIITEDRFTPEYFYKRMYFQGICESYTKLRKYKKFSDLDNRRNKKVTVSGKENMLQHIRDVEKNAYLDGYIDHQMEVKTNPKLFEWIKKKNYFEYNIENYIS